MSGDASVFVPVRVGPGRVSVAGATVSSTIRVSFARWPVVFLAVALGLTLAAAGPAQAQPAAVSFSRQVAPLLVRHCGGCHVAGRKGGFQMTSYTALMQSGMVQPRVADASRLVEVIATGDMPRGGGRVSPQELGLLSAWIASGAECDLTDPSTPLEAVARGMAPPPAARPAPAAMAAGTPAAPARRARPGDVSFAAEVAPVLFEHCGGCHGGTNPGNRLRIDSLTTLVRGGRSGPPVVAGRSGESLIVQKLRGVGIDGARMPLGRTPLSDDVIATIARWIDQGAEIDLLSPDTSLEQVAAAGRVVSLSDAELTQVRGDAARVLWRRAIPDDEAWVGRRGRVTVIGNLPEARMEELADTAGTLGDRIREELVSGDAPLLKGGVVLYLFRNGYDYSAFWQQAHGGERPRGMVGHAGMFEDVAYGAVFVPSSSTDPAAAETLMAEQIAGAALAGRGTPPWFVRGGGRAIAGKVVPKAAAVKDWRSDAADGARAVGSPADFLKGLGDPVASASAAGGFVMSLTGTGNRLRQCVAALDGGAGFDAAFAEAFRGAPETLYQAWLARLPKPRGRTR
jgi:mono/diheme cytochrome c family protein